MLAGHNASSSVERRACPSAIEMAARGVPPENPLAGWDERTNVWPQARSGDFNRRRAAALPRCPNGMGKYQ